MLPSKNMMVNKKNIKEVDIKTPALVSKSYTGVLFYQILIGPYSGS